MRASNINCTGLGAKLQKSAAIVLSLLLANMARAEVPDTFAIKVVGRDQITVTQQQLTIGDVAEVTSNDARFDDAVGRKPGFRHAEMQRHVGPLLGKTFVDLDHFGRIGIFQRNDVAREAERVE